jgi:hypothetical protein
LALWLLFCSSFPAENRKWDTTQGSFELRNQCCMPAIDRQRRYRIATAHAGCAVRVNQGNRGQCGFATEEVARLLEGQWYWRLRSYASNQASAHQSTSNTELVSQSMPCYKRIWDAQSHTSQKPMKGLSSASWRTRLTITTIRNQELLAMQYWQTPSPLHGKIAYSRVSWR